MKITDRMRLNWLQKQPQVRIEAECDDLFVRFSPDCVCSGNLRQTIDQAMQSERAAKRRQTT